MNVFGKFDEIPSMILQDIKKTNRYRHTFVRSFGRMDVKTVYPPTNTVCRGYNDKETDRENDGQGESSKAPLFQSGAIMILV